MFENVTCIERVSYSRYEDVNDRSKTIVFSFTSGVKTNIPFLQNVLRHQQFLEGSITTGFLDENPILFKFIPSRNRAQKLLSYLSEVMVNGPLTPLATGVQPMDIKPELPAVKKKEIPEGWRQVLQREGPAGFAKAIRKHPQ